MYIDEIYCRDTSPIYTPPRCIAFIATGPTVIWLDHAEHGGGRDGGFGGGATRLKYRRRRRRSERVAARHCATATLLYVRVRAVFVVRVCRGRLAAYIHHGTNSIHVRTAALTLVTAAAEGSHPTLAAPAVSRSRGVCEVVLRRGASSSHP